MAKNTLPTPEELRKLLEYDPATGGLRYREAWPDLFAREGKLSREARCNKWNMNHAGKAAFRVSDSQGYWSGSLFGVRVCAHRVIVAMATGQWPDAVDHINGDRQDNRLANLRAVSRAENAKNSAKPRSNTSGHIGVGWRQDLGRWRATIGVNGKARHLGTFESLEDAIAARAAADEEHGFHPNHGRDLT